MANNCEFGYGKSQRTIHPIFYLKILFSLFPFIAAFSKFSALKELELPLNNIHNTIKIQPDVFRNLETLDLSYNRLTDEDILTLGLLANLRTLHLTGIRASLNIKMYCILWKTCGINNLVYNCILVAYESALLFHLETNM